MPDPDVAALRELTALLGVAGFEDAVIGRMREEFSAVAQEVEVDPLGNVVAHLPSAHSDGPRVLIFAHMDEVGFVVRKIEQDGFVRLERVGGVPEKSMSGQALVAAGLEGRLLHGVMGPKAHHLTPSEEKYQVVPIQSAYADFGFASKADAAAAGLRTGSPVGYARTFFRNQDVLFSNAMDDRAGCWVLLEFLNRIDVPTDVDLWVVASVQEEFSLRGVLPAVRRIEPQYVFQLDVAVSTDTPDLAGYTDVRLGEGPTVGAFSFHGRGTLAGLIPNPKFLDHVHDVAARAGIPLQTNTFMGGLTETSFLQLENEGILAIDLGFPCRYTHAPVEVVNVRDLDRLVDLLVHLAHSLSGAPAFARG